MVQSNRKIDGDTLLRKINEIRVWAFSKWCRERVLLNETIKKFIERGIQEIPHICDLKRSVLERNRILPAQIEVIISMI
jgi:hypothetical protein